jgi:hypothetical protein
MYSKKWKVSATGYARSCYILITIDVVWNHMQNLSRYVHLLQLYKKYLRSFFLASLSNLV